MNMYEEVATKPAATNNEMIEAWQRAGFLVTVSFPPAPRTVHFDLAREYPLPSPWPTDET